MSAHIIHQTMSGQAADARIKKEAQKYAEKIATGYWTLESAHMQLRMGADGGTMSLFQIAGLAKAIACFQCSER